MKLVARLFFPLQPGAFRLALALLVFLHHCSRFAFGKYAVYVFFVLSGFWVDRMWTERYSKARNPLFTYGLSRAWRLLPTFILVGLIVTGVQLLIGVSRAEFTKNNPWHLMLSSIFIFGYSSLPYPPVGPAWSLDIEVQYYVVAPIMSIIAQRYGAKLLFLIAMALSVIAGLTIVPPTLIKYIFFFVCGMSASVMNWRPSQAMALSSMALMIVVLIVLLASPLRGALLGGEHLTAAYE